MQDLEAFEMLAGGKATKKVTGSKGLTS